MRSGNVMELALLLAMLKLTSLFVAETDAVHPGCKCLVFSSTFGKEKGIFHSPDYPTPYPPNVDCLLYSFVAGAEQIVEIEFLNFEVPRTEESCLRGDYVKMFLHLEEGYVNEYTPWTSVLCGRLADVPTLFYSSDSGLVLHFHSGPKSLNATGFKGTFRFINKRLFRTDGQKLPGTMCDYQFQSSGHTPNYGKFYSPRYPSNYPNNIRCSYRFKARQKERVRIIFQEVTLQKGDISCLNRADLIRVYDGRSTSDPAIRILCNEGAELEILSTGSDLLIDFVANSDDPGRGFKANYQFQRVDNASTTENRKKWQGSNTLHTIVGPSVSETRSSCDAFFTSDAAKNGTITSPSYPEPYAPRTTCSYEFQGRGKERVQVTFSDFHLYHTNDQNSNDCENQDALVAFVSIDGKMEKIDTFCDSVLPKPVMSNGPRLKLEFRSLHGSRYSKGFKATYAFVEDFGIKTGNQLTEYPCAFVYNSNESRSGTFHSPNFPGFYPRDTECYYFFHGTQDEKIRLHFYYFDIEGVLPCEAISASDYVEFSNYLTRDKKYTRQCGQLNEFDIESDRKFFRVTFRSNDRLDGTGFNASYAFVDQKETLSKSASETANDADTSNGGILVVLMVLFWMIMD